VKLNFRLWERIKIACSYKLGIKYALASGTPNAAAGTQEDLES